MLPYELKLLLTIHKKKTKWDLNKKYAFFCKSKHKIKKYSKETTEFRLKLYNPKKWRVEWKLVKQ